MKNPDESMCMNLTLSFITLPFISKTRRKDPNVVIKLDSSTSS